jgi:dTDP-4-dehydrorhamnose 3,5-epimerase
MIHGVTVFDLRSLPDERGSFTELYRASIGPNPVRQMNLSFSRATVLRGMHFHRRQSDYWVFVTGRAFVALYDLRLGSPTEGDAQTLEHEGEVQLTGLFVPPGVAHGFCALTDVHLLYLVSDEYAGDDEFGFAWNDPDLPITWPVSAPLVSARDALAPSLAKVLRDPIPYLA